MRLESDGAVGAEGGGPRGLARPNILSIIKLWPNVLSPQQGSQTENRLRALQDLGGARIRVIAPTPVASDRARLWRRQVFARGSVHAAVPDLEKRASIVVHHPRYRDFALKQSGEAGWADAELTRISYRAAVMRAVARLTKRYGPFDLFDAHGLDYDGWATRGAALRAKRPYVVTAYNSAARLLNLRGAARRRAERTLADARLVLSQGKTQANGLLNLGVDPRRLVLIRPGVDLLRFQPERDPAAREAMKRDLGAQEGSVLALSIAGDTEAEAHHRLAIAAVPHHPSMTLRIVGAGTATDALRRFAAGLGAAHKVGFIDEPTDMRAPEILRAADVAIVLADGVGGRTLALETLASGVPTIVSPHIESEGIGDGPAIEVASVSALANRPELAGAMLASRVQTLAPQDPAAAASQRMSARRLAEASPLRQSIEDLQEAFRVAALGDAALGGGRLEFMEAAAAPSR